MTTTKDLSLRRASRLGDSGGSTYLATDSFQKRIVPKRRLCFDTKLQLFLLRIPVISSLKNYILTTVNWINLLQKISLTIHNKVENNMIYYDKSVITNNWLGFDKAELKALEEKEKLLNTRLPPSYRDFLLTTNGFKQISLFSGNLYPVEQIDWMKKKDPDFLEIFEEHNDITISDDDYFVYGHEQLAENFKVSFLNETLQISEWVDGSVILLNPMVRFDEEWEAWIYANWFPGAKRYKSFRELIENEFCSTVKLIEKGPNGALT